MRKIILDFNRVGSRADVHDYLQQEFEFPPHYGRNLDALYDMLTDISKPTAVGFFSPVSEDFGGIDFDLVMYIDKVKEVFLEAEKANGNLAVILGDVMENLDETGPYDDIFNWQF